MLAQTRPLLAPAADADVDVVTLREDPPVAARNGGQLEHEHAAPAVGRKLLVGKIPLERDAVDDAAAEVKRARSDPVRAVCADQRVDVDELPIDAKLSLRLDC